MDEKTKTPEVIVEKTSEQADLSLFGLILEADFFVQFIYWNLSPAIDAKIIFG